MLHNICFMQLEKNSSGLVAHLEIQLPPSEDSGFYLLGYLHINYIV